MTQKTLPASVPDPKDNLLLAELDTEDFEALIAKSRVVSLKLDRRLYYQDDPVDAVYFPLTCMVSLLVSTTGKQPRLELATVGREGVVGASEVTHAQGALGVCLIQIPGAALRTPASAFLEVVRSRPRLDKLVNVHLYALTRQILQGAACNHLHTIEQRCARWLLASHDRATRDTFPLTQEFLSHMLGVRRATVNPATGSLRDAGLITFVRGKLTVLDRKGLEAASCRCYATVRKAYTSAMKSGIK
jgi:CRP-like cAMP-binding protein